MDSNNSSQRRRIGSTNFTSNFWLDKLSTKVDCMEDVDEEKVTFLEESFELILPTGMNFRLNFRIEYGFEDLDNIPIMMVDAWSTDLYEGQVEYQFNLNCIHEYTNKILNIYNQHVIGQEQIMLEQDFRLLDGQYKVSGWIAVKIQPTRAEIFMHQFKTERKINNNVIDEWQEDEYMDEIIEVTVDNGPADAKKMKVMKSNLIKISDVFNVMMTNNHFKEGSTNEVHFKGWKFDTIKTVVNILKNYVLEERNITPDLLLFTHVYEMEDLEKFIILLEIDKLRCDDERPKHENNIDFMIVSEMIQCDELFKLTSQIFMKEYISQPESISQDIRKLKAENPNTIQKLQELYKIEFC